MPSQQWFVEYLIFVFFCGLRRVTLITVQSMSDLYLVPFKSTLSEANLMLDICPWSECVQTQLHCCTALAVIQMSFGEGKCRLWGRHGGRTAHSFVCPEVLLNKWLRLQRWCLKWHGWCLTGQNLAQSQNPLEILRWKSVHSLIYASISCTFPCMWYPSFFSRFLERLV